MNREEALRQIQEISGVIESSNKFFMSGYLAIAYGIVLCLAPLFEVLTQNMTFGYHYGEHHVLISNVIHAAVYALIFFGLKFIVEKIWSQDKSDAAHPVLKKALAFHRPIAVAACGTIVVLGTMGQDLLIPAFMILYFGILLNLYGRFSMGFAEKLSWTYIFAGLLLGLLTPYGGPYLWMGFVEYLGLTIILLGFVIRRDRKAGVAFEQQ